MKIIIIGIALCFVLLSCAPGPVYVAKSENESMRTAYEDAKLRKLHADNEMILKKIYNRLVQSNINIYKEGIGLTILTDDRNEKLHYISINIRPSEISFDESSTKPEQRFSRVLGTYFPKYMQYIKMEDLDADDIEGLQMGVYWPVRDHSQCDQYGGFIEYIHVYFTKDDVANILNGRRSFQEVVQDTEVITSLNLQPSKSVRPVFN